MRAKFSKTVSFIPEWNGNRSLPPSDQIVCSIQPMTIDDLFRVMEAMGSKVSPTGEAVRLDLQESRDLMNTAKDLIPKYVEVRNLYDDDGEVTVDRLTTYAFFMPLAAEIIGECARVSSPSETTEGNSARLSG